MQRDHRTQRGQEAEQGPLIDEATIEALRELGGEDDPGLLIELIELFVDDATVRMDELCRAFDAGDLDAVRSCAHALKSASANVSALTLSTLCKEIESSAMDQATDSVAPLVSSGRTTFEQVKTALIELKSDCSG